MRALTRHQHDARGSAGRYRHTAACDGCGKPVGTAYYTDEEVCGGSDGPGFYLCERARCVRRRSALDADARKSLYESTRHAT